MYSVQASKRAYKGATEGDYLLSISAYRVMLQLDGNYSVPMLFYSYALQGHK